MATVPFSLQQAYWERKTEGEFLRKCPIVCIYPSSNQITDYRSTISTLLGTVSHSKQVVLHNSTRVGINNVIALLITTYYFHSKVRTFSRCSPEQLRPQWDDDPEAWRWDLSSYRNYPLKSQKTSLLEQIHKGDNLGLRTVVKVLLASDSTVDGSLFISEDGF